MAAPYLTRYSNQTDLLRAAQEAAWLNRRNINHDLRWYGKKNPQDATHWADSATLLSYQTISGLNTWGTDGGAGGDVAQVFGTGDLLWNDPKTGEVPAGGIFSKILFTANSSTTIYRFRLIYGTAAQTYADAVTARQYSETVFMRANADTTRVTREIRTRRLHIDCQIWAQCWNASNDATLDFLIGVHYYEYQTPYHPTVI